MKPYQVHLFTDERKMPDFLPSEPVFVYENKRYLNFLVFDCFHLKNSEYLKEVAKTEIEVNGIISTEARSKTMGRLQNIMQEIKKAESLLFFQDEIPALFAMFSIFGSKTAFFVNYETSPSISAVLQQRNIEYYDHHNLRQLSKALGTKSEKVMIIDGVYEWLGEVSPVNDLMKIAKDNDCVVIGNEMNSFGLLGRQGRGFIDLCNVYDAVNLEIGSFSRFLGGFGCYVGAKKYLMDKIKENIADILNPVPQFMLSVNVAALEFMKTGEDKNYRSQQLWQNSRYVITRLKQAGFSTISDTPMVVVSFNNNEEAGEFTKRLFFEQIVVAQNKERIRLNISIEHSQEDLDYCLERFECVGRALGIIHPE